MPRKFLKLNCPQLFCSYFFFFLKTPLTYLQLFKAQFTEIKLNKFCYYLLISWYSKPISCYSFCGTKKVIQVVFVDLGLSSSKECYKSTIKKSKLLFFPQVFWSRFFVMNISKFKSLVSLKSEYLYNSVCISQIKYCTYCNVWFKKFGHRTAKTH